MKLLYCEVWKRVNVHNLTPVSTKRLFSQLKPVTPKSHLSNLLSSILDA
uniref:Uncharacterized protein n=1 Tax=Rhizophora mucronata TaxID=61149 RepID=A0A2P2P9E1_RHIMU